MSIANPHVAAQGAKATRLRQWAATASLVVAAILIAAKFVAYVITDSVSLMSSLMDSTFDAVASAVMLFSIIHAASPADEDHRFGHGKLEAVAAMGQALFILGSAAYLFFESVHRFFQPQPVHSEGVGIAVMLLSLVLTLALVSFQRYVIRATQSVAIRADHAHYAGDMAMNVSVLLALVIHRVTGWATVDSLFAAGISIVLLRNAYHVGAEALNILMDKELSETERATIERLVKAHPRAISIHDLRTRHAGHRIFIEFHLEMDADMSLSAAHQVTEEIELMLYNTFPQSEVLIHQEPAGLDDHRLDAAITKASA